MLFYIKTFFVVFLAVIFAFCSFVLIEPYLVDASLVIPKQSLLTLRKKIDPREIAYLIPITVTITPTPLPTRIHTPTTTSEVPKSIPKNEIEWGVARKIDEHTYTITVGESETMASPQEIVDALNQFRATHGAGSLTPDGNLSSYAQNRANHFAQIGSTDAHAGFNNFLENEDGFSKLGFMRVGENSYYGVSLEGAHVIEWIFAASSEHNANQLNTAWTHVGVGANERAVNIIFGAK